MLQKLETRAVVNPLKLSTEITDFQAKLHMANKLIREKEEKISDLHSYATKLELEIKEIEK